MRFRDSLFLTLLGFLLFSLGLQAQLRADSSFSSHDSIQDLRMEEQERIIEQAKETLLKLYSSQQEALDSMQLQLDMADQHRELLSEKARQQMEDVARLEVELAEAWAHEKAQREKLHRLFLLIGIIALALLLSVFLANRLLGIRNRHRLEKVRSQMARKTGELSTAISGQEGNFLDVLGKHSLKIREEMKKQRKELKADIKNQKKELKSQKKELRSEIKDQDRFGRKKKKRKKYL